MSWATDLIRKLQLGETVQCRPRGNSMKGLISSGQLCTIEPADTSRVFVNSIVLCRVNGNDYLHVVKKIEGERFLIGNNRGGINGWISANKIYGRCIRVED